MKYFKRNKTETSQDPDDQDRLVSPLAFKPLPGLSSPHAQTVIACFSPSGEEPPSVQMIIPLADGDALSCEVSTPPHWEESKKTVILVHGLGGCHSSSYMVRLSRKLYEMGYRAVRVNLRTCGSGKDLASIPYHGGVSSDLFCVIEKVKSLATKSPITVLGFSLGGNIALKLAGELGKDARDLVEATFAVCPPVDLADTAKLMSKPTNHFYNMYYMRQLEKTTRKWTKGKPFSTIYEFDQIVTAPNWGFKNPEEYYQLSSSKSQLFKIKHPSKILFAKDDPFVDYKRATESKLSSNIDICVAPYGGHMGFFGWTEEGNKFYWMDSLLLKWIENGE